MSNAIPSSSKLPVPTLGNVGPSLTLTPGAGGSAGRSGSATPGRNNSMLPGSGSPGVGVGGRAVGQPQAQVQTQGSPTGRPSDGDGLPNPTSSDPPLNPNPNANPTANPELAAQAEPDPQATRAEQEETLLRDRERRRLLDRGKDKEHKPRILISSDELNVLIYSYLCESSFPHTAYTFRSESKLDHSPLFSNLNPDHPGRFPVGGPAPEAGSSGTPAKAGKGKGKEKEKEDTVDEADRMDVDPAATADEADVPAATTEGSKKKPALKRKASDRGQTTAASTPGPGSVVGAAAGGGGAAAGVVTGVRTREERFRAVPRGELIRHLYKGLMWDEVEKHAQYGWNEAPPCVTPFTLLTHHECTLAAPRYGQPPIIPPILINRKTNTPIYSPILTQEERAQLARQDVFPPAAEGSQLDRLERILGERESHASFVRRIRAEEKRKLRHEREERRREKLARRASMAAARSRREHERVEDEREDEAMDVDLEDAREKPERVRVRDGKRRQVEDVDDIPDIRVNGPSTSTSRDKERRERDRDKDRPRERDKPVTETVQQRTTLAQPPAAVTPTAVKTPPTYGKKKKRVLSSDETDMPLPNGTVAAARTKKGDETDRASPVASNGTTKEKKLAMLKRDDDRGGKSRDDDFVPKKRKLVNGDHESGRKEREMLGIGPGPGRPAKTSRIVSESTLTESEAESKRPNKKTGRARRNSNVSNNTKSERSGERQEARSVSQTPVPNAGTNIKAIFAGQKNPLQPVERDGMLCWRGHTKKINRVSWNPLNLTRLISCSQDGLCNIWDFADPLSSEDRQFRLLARTPIELVHRALQAKNPVVDLAWNNDGNAFVTIDKENVARSFVGDGELQGTGYRHGREITCVAWNPNGNYFATTNIDGQTCVWDISVVPIKLKNSWDHHAPHKAYHVDWLTDEIFATCSEDDTIVICSVNAVDRLATLSKHQDRVLVCKFSPKHRPEDKLPAGINFSTGTRRLLASGSDDHTVRIWDMQALEEEGASIFSEPRDPAKQPKELLTLEGHNDDIQLIQWCPRLQKDGKRLLVTMSMADPQSDSDDRHVIKMYDVNARDGNHCLYTIVEHREEIRALEFSPEGDMFLSCAEDGMLNIWNTETGQLKKRFSTASPIYDAKWRPDGEQLALAMNDATLRTIYVGDLLRRSST